MTETQEKTLSIEEVGERLGMSRAEVYRTVKDKVLKATKVEHTLQFSEAEVEQLHAKRTTEREGFQASLDRWLALYADRLGEHGETELPDLEGKSDDERMGELARRTVLDWVLTEASDLYLDPLHAGDRLLVRYEGHLQEIGRLNADISALLKGKIKALTPLTAAQGDQVYEGLLRLTHGDRVVQIRITVAPTLLGEHIHLHRYDAEEALGIDSLGYTPAQVAALRERLTGRPGLLLVAGAADPTADRHRLALATELTASGRLVVSLEHRIQYRSELLVQLEIGKQGGPGFDALLRMALGMSPDVLLLDDVRDEVEMQALLEVSCAGSVVVAQTRASGIVEVLLQFIESGLSADGLARTLLGMVERVALRRLCPHCRRARKVTPEEADLLAASPSTEVWESGGCEVCGDGILGRRMVYGVWPMDEELAHRIRSLQPPGTPLVEWRDRHPLSVGRAAREAVLAGEVALEDARILLTQMVSHPQEDVGDM